MWWKIYFWIVLVLTIIGVVFVYGGLESWDFAAFFEIITSIIGLMAVYAVAYGKKILNPTFWKVMFWLIVVNWVFNMFYAFTPLGEALSLPGWLSSKTVGSPQELLFGMVFSMPIAYAVYKLAYQK